MAQDIFALGTCNFISFCRQAIEPSEQPVRPGG